MANHAGFASVVVIGRSVLQNVFEAYYNTKYWGKQLRTSFITLDMPVPYSDSSVHIEADLQLPEIPQITLVKRSDDQIGIDIKFIATISLSSPISSPMESILEFRSRVYLRPQAFTIKVKNPTTKKEETMIQVGISFSEAIVESLDIKKLGGPDLPDIYTKALHDPLMLAAIGAALRIAPFKSLFVTPPIDNLSKYGISIGRIVIRPLGEALAVAFDLLGLKDGDPPLTKGDPAALFDFRYVLGPRGFIREIPPDTYELGDPDTYDEPASERPVEPRLLPPGYHNTNMAGCVNPILIRHIFLTFGLDYIRKKAVRYHVVDLYLDLELLPNSLHVFGTGTKIEAYGVSVDASFDVKLRAVRTIYPARHKTKSYSRLTLEVTSIEIKHPLWVDVFGLSGLLIGGPFFLTFGGEILFIAEIIEGVESAGVALASGTSISTVYTSELPGAQSANYPKAVYLGQLFKDLEFPADKEKIIQYLQRKPEKNAEAEKILSNLRFDLEEYKSYYNITEIGKVLGIVGNVEVQLFLADTTIQRDGITTWLNCSFSPFSGWPEWTPINISTSNTTIYSPWDFEPIIADLTIAPDYLPIGYFSFLDTKVRIRWLVSNDSFSEVFNVKDQSTLDPGAFHYSFTREDPTLATLQNFQVHCFLYRSIGGVSYQIFAGSVPFFVIDRLNRTIPYVSWDHEVFYPYFYTNSEGKRTWKYRHTFRRSDIHRTAVPGRCRFVERYSKDVKDPYFWYDKSVPKLNYISELPFPRSKLSAKKYRKKLCDYCFFGGPGKTTLMGTGFRFSDNEEE
jgi:hypothetical protein